VCGRGECEPILDINTHSAQVARKHAAVHVFVRQVAHAPAALVVHHDQRAAGGWRPGDGLVHAHADGVAIAGGDGVEGFFDAVWDRAWDRVQVPELLEVGGAGGAGFEEVGSCDVDGAGFEGLGAS
jgi:hypothetical protein